MKYFSTQGELLIQQNSCSAKILIVIEQQNSYSVKIQIIMNQKGRVIPPLSDRM